MAEPIRVAVCVCTYRRPSGLRRLLEALVRLDVGKDDASDRLRLDVIVVDNDAGGSAVEVIDDMMSCFDGRLHGVVEPRPGICAARNRALDEVGDDVDWVAFIDDDEVPESTWLANLIATQRRTNADVVTGPVPPDFETEPPDWIVRGRFFAAPSRPTGTPLPHAFTGNVLFRMSAVRDINLRFDERLGLVGGEDRLFFARLRRTGAKIVWCDSAVAHETIPASRMTADWLIHRMRRVGSAAAYIERTLDPGIVTNTKIAARGTAWLGLGAMRFLTGFHRARRVHGRRQMAYGRGYWSGLFGRLVREYRR